MSNPAEKRKRFELLLGQAQVPADVAEAYFSDGYIDMVEVSRSNREWHFHLVNAVLVPRDIYRSFVKLIRDQFRHIAEIKLTFHYTNAVTPEALAEEYWSLFVEWAQRESASINGWLAKARMEASGTVLTVTLLDQIGLELAKKKQVDALVRQFYERYFSATYQVKLKVTESQQEKEEIYDQFARQVSEEGKSVTQEILTSIVREEEASKGSDADLKLMVGYDIREDAVPLQQITEEEKKVAIQGMVFGLESK